MGDGDKCHEWLIAGRDFGRLKQRRCEGRKQLEHGETPAVNSEPGRMPWVSKLMSLALRFDGLVRDGAVVDQAELARLGHVSRARVTQIMNLLHLAPDIQEELLFLPLMERGRDTLLERHLRPIAAVPDWRKQRKMWGSFLASQNNEQSANEFSNSTNQEPCNAPTQARRTN